MFLIVQIGVFSAKGTISKATNKMFLKEIQFFIFLYSPGFFEFHLVNAFCIFSNRMYFIACYFKTFQLHIEGSDLSTIKFIPIFDS